MGRLVQDMPLEKLRENPVALRAVNRESEAYLGLCASIREKGFFGAISVRERTDSETNETYFELVDGLHRLSACRDVGLTVINVDVVDFDDDTVLEAQLVANMHKIETTPVQYTKQLRRILARNPMLTEAGLAKKLGVSTQFIQNRLGLTKISNEVISALIDEGKISLTNAYALSKLPPDEQPAWTDRAQTTPPEEFVIAVNARVKEIKEERRKGKDAGPIEFQPTAFMQKMKDVKVEMDSGSTGKVLIKQSKAKTAQEGWDLAVQWFLHLDPISVEAQRTKDAERKKAKDEQQRLVKAEQARKASVKAAEKAVEAEKAAIEANKKLGGIAAASEAKA